jgi:hypothetical protein
VISYLSANPRPQPHLPDKCEEGLLPDTHPSGYQQQLKLIRRPTPRRMIMQEPSHLCDVVAFDSVSLPFFDQGKGVYRFLAMTAPNRATGKVWWRMKAIWGNYPCLRRMYS